MKTMMLMLVITVMLGASAAESISISATPRYHPRDGKVDIAVTISGTSNEAAKVICTFAATNIETYAALKVSRMTGANEVSGSGNIWTRRFVWDAAADLGEVKIDDVVLIVEVSAGGVQLWENGPCWAECNVGAMKPEAYGYYFWWGDTVGYVLKEGKWNSYLSHYFDVIWLSSNGGATNGSPFSMSLSCPTYYKSESQLQFEGYIDSTCNLVAAHDAATAHLGAPWRMPTGSDFADLISKCDTVLTTYNGVLGQLVMGRGAYSAKSIFLPAAGCGDGSYLYGPGESGCYWASTASSSKCLTFYSSVFGQSSFERYRGLSVRPIREFSQPSVSTTHLSLDCLVNIAVPVISAESAAFDGASHEVTISCATEGATVYYTIDGSEPNAANGRVYKGPFNIYDSVTVKAIAVKDDWKDSAVASAAFTKNNGLSAAINMYDYLPETDATYPWVVVSDVTHDGVSAVKSGVIGANGLTYLQLTVRGAGHLSFWWKTTCEPMWDGAYYDYASFKVGGALRACLAGTTEWRQVVMDITTTGKHVLRWEYQKDDADSIPPDCVWLDQVQWVPADDSGHTLTTGVPVPYSWLESYGFGAETDFETAAKMRLGKVDGAGRAMSVEDDYVAGTDPTNLASKLTATIKMGADGKPILSWKPPLNGEDADGVGIREGVRRYSVLGKRDLGDVEEKWAPVAEGDESDYRFFKVKVEMP